MSWVVIIWIQFEVPELDDVTELGDKARALRGNVVKLFLFRSTNVMLSMPVKVLGANSVILLSPA